MGVDRPDWKYGDIIIFRHDPNMKSMFVAWRAVAGGGLFFSSVDLRGNRFIDYRTPADWSRLEDHNPLAGIA